MSYVNEYRRTIKPEVGTDCYPMDCDRVFNPIEKIWEETIGWNKYQAVDVSCDEFNMRYPIGLTKNGVIANRYFYHWLNVDHNQNSLYQRWSKFGKYIWCGAPYSNQRPWVRKCINESKRGAIVAGLFASSPNIPQKWVKKHIINKHFHFDMGRLNSAFWRRPNWNNLLVMFGVDKKHSELKAKLEEWKRGFENRIEIAKVRKELCYNDGYLLGKYCRKLGIVTTVGNEPIDDETHGRTVILYSDYLKIKEHILLTSPFADFFK